MMRSRVRGIAFFSSLFFLATMFAPTVPVGARQGRGGEPLPQQVGAKIETLRLSAGRAAPGKFSLAGRDARQQLIATGVDAAGGLHDLTRSAAYEVRPRGIVEVSATGVASALAEGQATITARMGEASASLEVIVSRLANDLAVNFSNQVTPLLTKLGCNSGGCHGKSGGQNGFALSLLGFDPAVDYRNIVHAARGRRVFPAAAEHSLLLLKATGKVPHGGGERLEAGSPEHRLIARWIAQGMPRGDSDSAKVTRIELHPAERTLAFHRQQQLACIAHYSDGSTQDVTALARFESNEPALAEVDSSGLVTANDRAGVAAVMAQYQGRVAVFRATIPLGEAVADLPPPQNFIDEAVYEQWRKLGLPPSAVCDDATFLRRARIDITGRLPMPSEVQAFLADSDPQKRRKLVDRLLETPGYADYFANKWSALLRNRRTTEADARGTFLFHAWIREGFLQNKPYDQFVRELLTAAGEMGESPPVVWYREVRDSSQQIEDVGQVFLGTRIQCAHCHHHPLEKWSQDDYFGMQAFFSRVARKKGDRPNEDRIFHRRGKPTVQHSKTKQPILPRPLDGETIEVSIESDPRSALVDWMVEADNPYFARALANRYWKHFFGRGIVEPEDDMRETNPASNPRLLDALARHFVDSGYDLKQLIRSICTSNAYQLSAVPNAWNEADGQNFSRGYPRRLAAEVLLDAVDQVCGTQTQFSPMPAGTPAVALPDAGFRSHFLTVFGRPEGLSACECERIDDSNLAQCLHLLNSPEIQAKLSAADGHASQWSTAKGTSHEENIQQLYLLAYGRPPEPAELATALAHLQKSEKKKQAYEDLIWALLNSKEFLFNH